jgi:site-specific recombinase XerD
VRFPIPTTHDFGDGRCPYQYVREPLTADESDRLSSACETTTERLVVWTLLDTGLRVGALCGLTPRNVSPHILRHTFATTALQKGISLPTVQKILGHDRLATTAIYSRTKR